MSAQEKSRACIEGATSDINEALADLPAEIRWALCRKCRCIITDQIYGTVEVGESFFREICFHYHLEFDANGFVKRDLDGAPVVKVEAITRRFRKAGVMKALHNIYVILALSGVAYSAINFIVQRGG